ncbi:hypothetical protein [Massilia sp. H6]|uniref:hypothetical protein n=1 Tax=Massilia sp. H6 TaxID=2970464 RepID=UPI0021673AD4|nr:hypothetical protein [Massilia sp. H6]UVW30035.1 hypothetical protein NRS07_07925 [Massilia sp. H6]
MHTDHPHESIHPATIDRSKPAAPKRSFARGIVAKGRRLRQRMGVALGLGVGVAALVVAME